MDTSVEFANDPCPECGACELSDLGAFDPLQGWSTCLDPDMSVIMHWPVYLACQACHACFQVSIQRANEFDGTVCGYYANYGRDRTYTISGEKIDPQHKEDLLVEPSTAARCAELEKLMYGANADLNEVQRRLTAESWPARKLKYWLRAAIYYGRTALAETLVNQGASLVNQLAWAIECKHMDLALWLLERGADPNDGALDFSSTHQAYPEAQLELPDGKGPILAPNALSLAGAAPVLEKLLAAHVKREPRWLTYRHHRTPHGTRASIAQSAAAQQTGVYELLQPWPKARIPFRAFWKMCH
jgi:hypothetical protein